MYDSAVIANRFLELAKNDKNALTIMQVLKLVYIAHGWFLGVRGLPLIKEDVQAWTYGPVIAELYDKIRHYRSRHVTRPIDVSPDEASAEISSEADAFIRRTYQIYGRYTGPGLSRITHREGSPWSQIYAHGKFGDVIPVDVIEDYYARLKRENEREAKAD